jgi:predicted permease
LSFYRRLANLFSRSHVEQEIDAELKSHLEMRIEDNVSAGMSPEAARRNALLRFGNPAVVKESATAADAALFLGSIWADIRYAFRRLTRSPGFAATAILTLALGIGASTAIFSVANAVLLRPLPYTDPDRLVIAGMDLRNRNVRDLPFSNADFIDLREGTKAFFKDMATVFTNFALAPREDGTAEQILTADVTANFFRLTGARIALGRDFTDQDGTTVPPAPPAGEQGAPAAPPVPRMAILSHEYFQKRYAGNSDVLGHTMLTTGGPGLVIVGVLAPQFHLYFPPDANVETAPDVWIADRIDYDAANRNSFGLRPVGRLKDGVTLEQAQAAASQVGAEERKNFPLSNSAGVDFTFASMHQHLVAEVRPAILALMGSVIFLLLIACANVANLLLVRASLRERELAMRAALGAGRWQLLRPILAEASLLAAMGTLLGLGLAWVGIHQLRVLAPENLPRLDSIRIDPLVLAFAGLAGLLSALLFGLAPAWRASQAKLMNLLRGTRTSGLAGGGRLRALVVIVEVALSFTLLVGSGLMFRSFLQLQRVDPGFDPRNLLTFEVLGVGATRRNPEARASQVREIEQRLRSLSGVQNVTASGPFPLTGGFAPIRWGTGEALADPSKFQAADEQIVLPGYFEAMRTPLLAGRTFTDDDNLPGRNYVMIDESLARKAFGTQSAVGKRILIRNRTPEAEWVEVVGVVAHQHDTSLATPGREQVYFTDAFVGYGRVQTWAIRTGTDAASYGNRVRAAIKEIDPSLVVTEMQPMEVVVHDAQANTRFSLLLIVVFAVTAGVLAGVGLYSVLATAVRQRTSEIGVRMALGAGRANIFELVVGQGLLLSACGIAAGLIAALLLTRAMSTMLISVKPTDPATFISMTLVFLLIAALASYVPARRAAGLDPTTALREE